MRRVLPPTVIHGFQDARRTLSDALNQLVFCRVTVVSNSESTVRAGLHYNGEAIDIRTNKKCFFSRFGRQFEAFMFLGIRIADCIQDHPLCIPEVGDILVGSLTPTGKKIPFELRGWTNGGKPLVELMRIVQYGTHMPEKEIRRILTQPASSMAHVLVKMDSLKPAQLEIALKLMECQDDIFLLARITILMKLTPPLPDEKLFLSKPYEQIMDILSMKLNDMELVDKWITIRPPTIPSLPPPVTEYSYVPEDKIKQIAEEETRKYEERLQKDSHNDQWGWVNNKWTNITTNVPPPTLGETLAKFFKPTPASNGDYTPASPKTPIQTSDEYIPKSPTYPPTLYDDV